MFETFIGLVKLLIQYNVLEICVPFSVPVLIKNKVSTTDKHLSLLIADVSS